MGNIAISNLEQQLNCYINWERSNWEPETSFSGNLLLGVFQIFSRIKIKIKIKLNMVDRGGAFLFFGGPQGTRPQTVLALLH